MFITSKIIHPKILHPKILVHGSNSLSGIPNRSTLAFLLKYAGSFPYYAGKFPYYAGIMLSSMEGYQCQNSTLCNKRSNKKECGINKK